MESPIAHPIGSSTRPSRSSMRADMPVAGELVRVSQRRHAFTFGCTGFEAIPLANEELIGEDRQRVAALYDRWLELFNVATLPFYWAGFEPRRGAPATRRLQAAARWFVDRGVAVKGHPLCWHTETAKWLSNLTTDEIAAAQVARIRREIEDFSGLIDTWDVINEVVIMPVFDRYDNGITRLARERGQSASSGWCSTPPVRPTLRRRCSSTTSTCRPITNG